MWLKTITGSMGVWDKLSYENFVPFHQLGLKEDPLLFIYIHIYICCCFGDFWKLIILGKIWRSFLWHLYWQVAKTCLENLNDSTSHLKAAETQTSFQVLSFRVIVGVLLKGFVKCNYLKYTYTFFTKFCLKREDYSVQTLHLMAVHLFKIFSGW